MCERNENKGEEFGGKNVGWERESERRKIIIVILQCTMDHIMCTLSVM